MIINENNIKQEYEKNEINYECGCSSNPVCMQQVRE